MTKISNNKPVYDLAERTFSRRVGTKAVRFFVKIFNHTGKIKIAWNFLYFTKPVTLFIPGNYLSK